MDSTSSETVYPADDNLHPPEVEELSSPVPHTLSYTHASRSIAIAGWTITATKLPISSSSEGDQLSATLGIPVPEMSFGNNSVNIAGPNGWQCEFNTQEALDAVDKTGSQGMKVSYSEQWNRTRHRPAKRLNFDWRAQDSEDIKGIVKPYDWTYTTPYRGTVNQPVSSSFNLSWSLIAVGHREGVASWEAPAPGPYSLFWGSRLVWRWTRRQWHIPAQYQGQSHARTNALAFSILSSTRWCDISRTRYSTVCGIRDRASIERLQHYGKPLLKAETGAFHFCLRLTLADGAKPRWLWPIFARCELGCSTVVTRWAQHWRGGC